MKVIVLSTQNQAKYTLNIQGNTLGEVKSALTEKGVSITGMTFFEGRTKTELLSNESILPENPVIRLTKSQKNITSGAETIDSRTAAYTYIKSNDLGEEVSKKYGRNFTQCSNTQLFSFCNTHMSRMAKKEAVVVASGKSVLTKDQWLNIGLENNFIDSTIAEVIKEFTSEDFKVEVLTDKDLAIFAGM